MGKNSVRRKRDLQAAIPESVNNMQTIADYRQRRVRKTPLISFEDNFTARNERQANMISAIYSERVVIAAGPAGTGKTHVAVATALRLLATGQFEKLYIARPAVEAEGERLGHLPGTADDKLYPFLIPIFDILEELLGKIVVGNLIQRNIIEIVPLAFLRGRTLKNAVVILDEMQNATLNQFRMALTRLGNNSKCIIAGDPDPSQNDRKGASGLPIVMKKLSSAPGCKMVEFKSEDIVRDEIVKVVLEYLA